MVIPGFASESLTPKKENSIVPDIPATVAAVKNPTSKIVYDVYNHEHPPGDPSKRAFANFVLYCLIGFCAACIGGVGNGRIFEIWVIRLQLMEEKVIHFLVTYN